MEDKNGHSHGCSVHPYENRASRRAHRFNHPIRVKRINKRKQKQAKR
jgi:hypothetical protein